MDQTHKEMMTIRKAVLKGHCRVNLPFALFILLTGWLLSTLHDQQKITALFKNGGILLSIIVSLIYRSIAITKWRIWAYQHTAELDELKYRANRQGLSWTLDGALEYRTKSDQVMLDKVEAQYKFANHYAKDHAIPVCTKLYFSKRKKIFSLILVVPIFLFGCWLFDHSTDLLMKIIAGAEILLFGFLSFINIKDLFNNLPQLTISEQGIEAINLGNISWAEIANERITTEYTSKGAELNYLEFDYLNDRAKILIDDFDQSRIYIEKLIRVYPKRFERNKPGVKRLSGF